MTHAKNIADFKAVSMNVMHSSMEITDEFYSVLNDGEVQNRINSLGENGHLVMENQEIINLFEEFLLWKKRISK